MTDPDPRPIRAAATDRVEPVTARDIAAFTARLARLRSPALGGDPAAYAAEHAALLAHKAELFARIADQHAGTDPAHAGEAREIAERAHAAAQHTVDAHDTTNVKDLPSPSFPGWGISASVISGPGLAGQRDRRQRVEHPLRGPGRFLAAAHLGDQA